MTKVKICGISDPVAFDAAVEAGADWVGFNFFPPSPRAVSARTAAALSGRVNGGPPRVGLFVEPTDALIASVLDILPLDVLQIYGRPSDIPRLKERFGLPIWWPVGVASYADLPTNARGADALLVEAKAPEGANRPGGNAVSFDWSVLGGWTSSISWLLAGGLTPDNVADAVRIAGAKAVDVSSGVERRKGVKDPALIRSFIRKAKSVG